MTPEEIKRAGLWANLPPQTLFTVLEAFEAGKRAAVEAIVEALCGTSKD